MELRSSSQILTVFLFMYIRKDAASSSQIEGTKATMTDAIEAESNTSDDFPDDVDDIYTTFVLCNLDYTNCRRYHSAFV